MAESSRILQDITSQDFKRRDHSDRIRIFNDFAGQFGWHPSDYLGPEYGLETKSNGHLIVEHGLEHAAVITFMAEPARTVELSLYETRVLLEVSYNNLVDLHLIVDQNVVAVYFNRSDSPKVEQRTIDSPDFAALRAEDFQKRLGYARVGNIPALDTVMIGTIDYWKRFLHGEILGERKNESVSALFNAIIFVRAVEDHYQLKYGKSSLTLLERWRKAENKDLPNVLASSLRSHKAGRGASSLLSLDRLEVFKKLDPSIVEALISDFYKIKRTPYAYNFALMSRHALSRIYEKYVALLREEQDEGKKGRTLFPIDLPEAQRNKAAGAIYTPQFIPRFFCRFIEEQLPPKAFRELEVVDPACGSGIFLRTFLEQKVEGYDLSTADIRNCFRGVLGLDVDENACQASRLSLALLHLMRTDKLPTSQSANILTEEAIRYFQSHPNLQERFGAVVGNPPFVRWELQTEALRERVRNFLSDVSGGRPDLYLGILRTAMRMVKKDGYLAFVLPHSFLVGEAPKAIRRELRRNFWIRSVVDLSAIRVFEDYSAYVILLIAQKKSGTTQTPPACRVVLCQEFVGNALQDCLDNKTVRTPYYSVFDVEQEYFDDGPWILLGPEETRLEQKLKKMCTIDDFLVVREGIITGGDAHYIMGVGEIPGKEKELFVPFLPDRQIERYTVPKRPTRYVYYPYRKNRRIPEEEIKNSKSTWGYLKKIKEQIGASASRTWPYLVRGREKELLQPKIVAPHLVLVPRFALDVEGKYAISRGPFIIPRVKDSDLAVLKFFAAVLNSSVVHWYLGSHAYRFSRGYVMLDPKYMRHIPVPDPSKVAPTLFVKIIDLVDERMKGGDAELEKKIDALILETYGLDLAERELLGAEGGER